VPVGCSLKISTDLSRPLTTPTSHTISPPLPAHERDQHVCTHTPPPLPREGGERSRVPAEIWGLISVRRMRWIKRAAIARSQYTHLVYVVSKCNICKTVTEIKIRSPLNLIQMMLQINRGQYYSPTTKK
jgi:hypothetical protein